MADTNVIYRNKSFEKATFGVVMLWGILYFGALWPNGLAQATHIDSLWRNSVLHVSALGSTKTARAPSQPLISGPSAVDIESAFAKADYSLKTISEGSLDVPHIRLSGMPVDMIEIADTDARKDLFLRIMLPMILSENESILADRARIEAIRSHVLNNRPVSRPDGEWLGEIARIYRISPSAGLAKLLRRVDVVPPSLALAQAAEETGWGTSRFARQGNALFGQWGAPDDRQGQTQAAYDIESAYNVRTFATPSDAVRSYVHNLNTHQAYAEFRDLRAWQRRQGVEPDGASLVHALENYSELAMDYVKSLRKIMRGNRLGTLDDAHLSEDSISLTF